MKPANPCLLAKRIDILRELAGERRDVVSPHR